jgi:TRAP-type C4-dicarboxylate transport system permease large subunit
MKLYLLSQDKNSGYDTYSACVVAAKSAKAARLISPTIRDVSCAWASPEHVTVTFIGDAAGGTKAGVILSSFHAG